MLSEIAGEVGKAFAAQLATCEALCFATDDVRNSVSVLVVDSVLVNGRSVEHLEHGGRRYEVLTIADLRTVYRFELIETFTVFLRNCVVLKDEYHDLFDAMQIHRGIVLHDPVAIIRTRELGDPAGFVLKAEESDRNRGGYFSNIDARVALDTASDHGYKVLCTGVPSLHRFIKRQCFDLLGELKDVTRSIEFALYRNGRLPQSMFSLEFYNIDHLNKPEFEKRLSLFCATRNRYPAAIHFRLFRSDFGNDARSAYVRAVTLKLLADHFPKTTSSQGFLRAIGPVAMAILLGILKSDDRVTASAKLNELIRLQLRHILIYKALPGEITNKEKIAYQLDLNTDTMIYTQKAVLWRELGKYIRNWEAAVRCEDGTFHSFTKWRDVAKPSHAEAINLLFDSYCLSPYSGYYFLRMLQALLNEKA